MNEITPFVFPATGQPVRSVVIDGEPWFVGSDVTAILGYANGRMAIGALPTRMKDSVTIPDGTPGNPNRAVINEAGVYRLVMRSNLPAAETFQDWLAEEVIPSIRKTGSYAAAPERPMSELEMAQRYVAALEREQQLTAKVAELEPSANAWDTLADASGDYSVRDAAQILDRDPLISTGQNRLFTTLRELGWIDAEGKPYQSQVDAGRLVRRPTSYTHPRTLEPVLTSQVRITAKGLRELHKRLGGFGTEGGLVAVAS